MELLIAIDACKRASANTIDHSAKQPLLDKMTVLSVAELFASQLNLLKTLHH